MEARVSEYSEDDLSGRYLGTFHADDFAVFSYPPKRYERFQGHNDTTDLVLDFKDENWDAVAEVSRWATRSINENLEAFRDRRGCRYIVAAPKHNARSRNVPVEELCARLAVTFRWLTHLDGALARTTDVPKSAGAAVRPTVDQHIATIDFTAPTPVAGHEVDGRPYCPVHRQRFRGQTGFDYHNKWAHAGRPADVPGAYEGAFLLVDDVITHGATSSACRRIIHNATGRDTVGFFVGKTGGW
jgi:hypothetical protein